ncbi:hypothetical protein TELCIR_12127 [Teladorsagia circumcincta]|uniref:OCEL domain-containing protein n=1 Tax=Teladorsagia circumcincta TaxID=45464 RepID=A0A2G9U9M2_TELCI|nr:hypothetical protein TELCIR_12127 [Teladorsagia circumcincta]
MASPRFDGSPEQAALDVHRLESDCGDYESVVMVKLTDEIVAALMQAQRKGLQIRVHIEEQGGKWELGDPANGGRVFRYQQQALPGPPTDAVVHDPRTGTHRAVAAFRSKYQIQATDKSFADTRERAQKLIEEEKSRGTKDVTKHRQKGNLLKTGTPRLGSASSSQNVSPLLTRTLDNSSSRSSPNKVLRQLRKDGLNEEAGIERRVEDIVREVSEPSGSAIPTPPSSRPASAVSAPIRKTPPPKNLNVTMLNGSREQTPTVHRSPHQPEVPSANKRKAHVPATTQQRPSDGKRPRQESASPPEDPTNHPQHNQIKNVQEAEKYFALFQQEYPEYLECYRTLNEVAKEFRQLEMQLKNAVENRKDTTRVEQTIQMRFAHFDKDPEFIKTRQRYADLHSKLAVLKSRISDFERAQDVAASASTAVPMDLCDLE